MQAFVRVYVRQFKLVNNEEIFVILRIFIFLLLRDIRLFCILFISTLFFNYLIHGQSLYGILEKKCCHALSVCFCRVYVNLCTVTMIERILFTYNEVSRQWG